MSDDEHDAPLTPFEKGVERYAKWLLRNRMIVLAATAVLLVGALFGATKLQFDTTFRIWHPPESEQLRTYDQRIARFGSDDSMLVIYRDEKGVLTNEALGVVRRLTDELWRIPSIKRVDSLANFSVARSSRVEHESPALAVSAKWIVAAGDHNDVLVWDRATGAQRALTGHDGLVEHLVLAPDQNTLWSASQDRTVRRWDLVSGQQQAITRALPESASALVVSSDGRRAYVASYRVVLALDAQTLAVAATMAGHDDFVTQLALSPDGSRLYTASKDIQVWDTSAGTAVATWPAHKQWVNELVLSPDGQHLYSAGDDGRVLDFSVASGQVTERFVLTAAQVLAMTLDDTASTLVIGVSDGSVRGLPVAGGPPKIARVHGDWVLDLAAGKGGRIYSGSRDRDVVTHIPGQGPRALTLQAHRGAVRRVVVDAAGTIVSMGDEGDIYVWAPETHDMLARYYRSTGAVSSVPVAFTGPKTGEIRFHNAFRYPIELRIAGEKRGLVLGSAEVDVTGLATPLGQPCEDDSACGPGEYCDAELEAPACTGRALVEALAPGTNTLLWSGEATLRPGERVTVRSPTEEPFSVLTPAEAPVDARARVGELKKAWPQAGPALDAALTAVLGADAAQPQAFVTPKDADTLAAQLQGKVDDGVVQFLGSHAQTKVGPYRLPIQPFRLRELGYYLTRGPVAAGTGIVINEARDSTVVAANVQTTSQVDPLSEAMRVRRALEGVVAAETQRSGKVFHLAGDAIQDTTFQEYAERDISTLFPMFVGMVIIVLAFWYRRPAGVAVPLGLVLLAIINTMGFSALMGAKLNNMTVAIPQVVLACCVGDLNHVFNGYLDRLRHGDTREQAVVHTIVFEFVPCFWTAFTTSLGFFSMIYGAAIEPIATFGWMGGIAAMAAWFGTFTVMPCILSMLPIPHKQLEKLAAKEAQQQQQVAAPTSFAARMDLRLVALSRYSNRTAGTVLFMCAIAIGVASYGLTRVSFDTNSIEFFGEDAPFRKACNFAQEHISGPFGIAVVVDTKEDGGIRKTEKLAALTKLQDHLRSDPEVTSVVGLADILNSMNRVMNGDMEENHRTPETDAKASSYYNAYTFSLTAGLELSNRVSADERATLVDVRVKNHAAGWIKNWGHDLQTWAAANTPELEVSVTGKAWLYSHMLTSMAQGFFSDVGQAVFTISIVLFILARNFRMGLIAMFVNLLPLYLTIGFTALSGKTMDLSILISCSVAMGIVVDDTIHYVAKYKKLVTKHGMDHNGATEFLAKEHSKASIATTLVLVGGFLMFSFTDYQINKNFGLTTAIMLSVGLMFDLFILPASLRMWGPQRAPAPEEESVPTPAPAPGGH